MSKPSRRANRQGILELRKQKRKAEKKLRQADRGQNVVLTPGAAISNGKSRLKDVAQETQVRQQAVSEQVRIFRNQLPTLLKRLSRIKDPRNTKKTKYQLTLLMIYGILSFVFQMSSRREANREMSLPMFKQNLKLLFPELDDLPHSDTLMRLLERINVAQIESAQLDLVKSLIRKKKFYRYLIDGRYPIAVDGTQKFSRDYLWSEECLQRKVGKADGDQMQYYVYVLEASLAFSNGMTIPLISEFLSYRDGDTDTDKQDCELKAFKRLAARLKSEFKRLPILLLLDGLYPNGPVLEICCNNHWDFMIVLQDGSLGSVWEEYDGLIKLLPENRYQQKWANRRQRFCWVNDIEYYYDRFKKQIVHVIVCEESWQEVEPDTGEVVPKTSRHAWISGQAFQSNNIHQRCNLAARHRWNIESEILVVKRHGYQYEHCFSYNWNAMKGYHYLMRLGLTLNVLAQYSECLIQIVREKGVRGFIKFVRNTISGPWLDAAWIQQRLAATYQLRLL